MTPSEMAQQLYDAFHEDLYMLTYTRNDAARNCAWRTADAIVTSWREDGHPRNDAEVIEYWEEVKEELQKITHE